MSDTNDKKYCVYVHINKINGKVYVGQTCQKPEHRWKNGDGYKGSSYFYHAIQKYGWDNFEHIVYLSHLSLDDANYYEKILIEKFNAMNPEKGYNLRSGGDGYVYSEQTKHKISESRKGMIFSEEHRKNISKARKGQCLSEETKQKLSEMRKGEKHPLYGTHRSKETKTKLSKANRGRKLSKESRQKISRANKGKNHANIRKIAQYDLDGNLIKVWDYIMQVEIELNIDHSNISKCCSGKRNSCGGFIWKYIDLE